MQYYLIGMEGDFLNSSDVSTVVEKAFCVVFLSLASAVVDFALTVGLYVPL